jgi:hypothetical protein
MSADVQSIVLRKPLAAVVFLLLGLVGGVIASVVLFATCLERAPQEFVRYTDANTGRVHTVPYVRATPTPSPATSPIAPTLAAAPAPGQKKRN